MQFAESGVGFEFFDADSFQSLIEFSVHYFLKVCVCILQMFTKFYEFKN